MVTLETGYGITQVVKASVNISQNTIQDYTQPEDQFPVSTYLLCFPVCHCWNIGIEKKDISWTLHSVIKRGLVYEDVKIKMAGAAVKRKPDSNVPPEESDLLKITPL